MLTKRKVRWALLAGAALASSAGANAQTVMSDGQVVPEAIYARTEARFAQVHRDTYGRGDSASPPPVPLPSSFMFRAVDINADGQTDWLVDFYRGSHGLAGFCGTGGCLQELYVSRPDGTHVLALSTQTLGLDIRKRKGALPLVALSVHGTQCTGIGNSDCRIGMEWSKGAGALVPIASAMTTASIRGFNALQFSPVEPPKAVLDKLEADGKACLAAGMVLSAEVARESAYPLIDFNGDGIADWFVGTYCDEPEAAEDGGAEPSSEGVDRQVPQLSSALYISKQQDFAEALTISGDSSLFLSAPRPVFVVADEQNDCVAGMGSNCGVRTYVWDKASGTMQMFVIQPLSGEEQQALQSLEIVALADRWPLAATRATVDQARRLEGVLVQNRPPNDFDLARVRLALGALLLDQGDNVTAEGALRLAVDALQSLGAGQNEGLARARVLLARAIVAPERLEERMATAASAFYATEPASQTAWLRNRAAELLIPASYRTSTFTVSAEDFSALQAEGAGKGPESWADPADFTRYAAGLARQEFRWDDAIALGRALVAGAQSEQTDYTHLASDLATIARLDEAEGIARKSVILAETRLGRDHPQTLRAQSDLGGILLTAGKVDEAESLLQSVVARMGGASATSHDLPLALRRLADCALVLGRVTEAEPLLERALAAEAELQDRFVLTADYDEFAATRALAKVQVLTGKGHKAARALAASLQLVSKETPATLELLLDYLDLADAHAKPEERASAAYFAKADDDNSASIAAGAVRMAQSLYAEPHPAIARALALQARLLAQGKAPANAIDAAFEQAIEHARQLPGDGTTGGLAIRVAWAEQLLKQPQRHQRALEITAEAVAIARNQRAALRGAGGVIVDPAIRRAFILRSSALLAGAKRSPAQIDEAFRTLQEAEVSLSAMAVARATLGRSARTEQEKALVAAFADAEREARNQDKLLHDALMRGDGKTVERLLGSTRTAREREVQAEQAVREAFPTYAQAKEQPILSLQAARDALPAGAALLLLSADDQDVLALLVTQQDFRSNRRIGEAATLSRKLGVVKCTFDPQYCTADANAALSNSLATAGWEPDDPRAAFDLASAHGLYASVLSPLLKTLPAGTLLVSVQQGWLSALPLAALPIELSATADLFDPVKMKDVTWLADRHPMATLPFAGILTRSRPPLDLGTIRQPFFGIGDPLLAGRSSNSRGFGNLYARRGSGWHVEVDRLRALSPLPATQIELKAMAAIMRTSANESLRLAAQAREGQVRSDERLARANILAIATHGLMPSELQGLQEPGLVMTPPDQPSDDDDGLWTASEVRLQTINATLVVLSACNTASSEGSPGADSLSALARAFFLSGAGAVLASRWSVPDEPTAALTVEALDGIANGKLDQPHALQAAMKAVRTGKNSKGADLPGWTAQWSHPSAWAAFSIYSSSLAN